jgi:hypothetical protein
VLVPDVPIADPYALPPLHSDLYYAVNGALWRWPARGGEATLELAGNRDDVVPLQTAILGSGWRLVAGPSRSGLDWNLVAVAPGHGAPAVQLNDGPLAADTGAWHTGPGPDRITWVEAVGGRWQLRSRRLDTSAASAPGGDDAVTDERVAAAGEGTGPAAAAVGLDPGLVTAADRVAYRTGSGVTVTTVPTLTHVLLQPPPDQPALAGSHRPVAISPDGSYLVTEVATGAGDARLALWDIVAGSVREVGTAYDASGAVRTDVAWSIDGRLLLLTSGPTGAEAAVWQPRGAIPVIVNGPWQNASGSPVLMAPAPLPQGGWRFAVFGPPAAAGVFEVPRGAMAARRLGDLPAGTDVTGPWFGGEIHWAPDAGGLAYELPVSYSSAPTYGLALVGRILPDSETVTLYDATAAFAGARGFAFAP